MAKSISVENDVWAKLWNQKCSHGFKTMNELVDHLLKHHEYVSGLPNVNIEQEKLKAQR